MAINKKLISFATQIQFDNQLSAGDIDNRSIVFIEDKKRIWTHGVYFDTLWDYIQNKPSTLDGYGITDAAKKINSLYYVEGNTTGTAGAWTGSVPEITSLYAGLTIAYKIGVAGATTTNLNINSLGNKLVRRNTSNLTTHLPVGSVAILTYDGTYWVWADYDSNSNTYDRTYWGNAITAGAPIYSYKLLMQGLDGKFYPLTLETGTGTTKTISTQEFEINSQILYYATTTTIAANGTTTNVYSEYPVTTLSYTANQASWVSQQLIYLKGTILSNGNFKLDNTSYTGFITQTLPTTVDGFVYVLLGYMYTTTAMRLFQFHPMYEYRDGALRTYMPMHSHGNITDGGAIGSVANKPIITGAGGILQVGSFGTTANTFAEGNDSRINNGQTAYSWGNHTGLYPSRANGLGASINSIAASDTRSVNPLPSTDLQRGVWFDFKNTSTIGIPAQPNRIYAGTITMVPYGDNSGNAYAAYRQAFTRNNTTGAEQLWFQGYATDGWTSWKEIYHTGNFTPGDYVLKAGDTISGTLVSTTSNIVPVIHKTTNTGTAILRMGALTYDKGFGLGNMGELIFGDWSTVGSLSSSWNKIWHSGNLANGTTAQYIRGDGSLATYTDTTYSLMSLAELNTGTATTSRVVNSKNLNDWLSGKNYYNSRNLAGATVSSNYEADNNEDIRLGGHISNYGTSSWLVNRPFLGYGGLIAFRMAPSYGFSGLELAYDIGRNTANGGRLAFRTVSGADDTVDGANGGYKPWKEISIEGHAHTFASLTSKPTTLSGYDITDGMYENNARSSTDLNLQKTQGFYAINSSPANSPNGAGGYGNLLVVQSSSDRFAQMYFGTSVNELFYRNGTGGTPTWGTWNKIWHEGNFNPANYLPLTGGTLTGALEINLGALTNYPLNLTSAGVTTNIGSLNSTWCHFNTTAATGFYFYKNIQTPLDVTARNFIGALSGNATTATTATNLSRSIIAGNGLSGGGVLNADRTITLGTPSSITATSTNSVTATSHTHNLVMGTGSGLDADLLDGIHSKNLLTSTIYNPTLGCLVQTDIPQANSAMCTVYITGYGYPGVINTQASFYSYNNSSIINYSAINYGVDFGDIKAFVYNGVVCLWFTQARSFQSFQVVVNYTNTTNIGNRVNSVTNSELPATAERLVTITPVGAALLSSNVASATKLQTARTIAGVSFNGTANIAIPFENLSNIPNTLSAYGISASDTMLTAKNAALITSTITTGITNTATSNINTYLNIVQGGSVSSSTKITGAGAVTVSSDINGAITIHGSEGITYLSGTKELLQLGIDTTNRVWSGKTLKDWYLEEIDILLDSDRFTGSTFSSNVIDLTNVNGAFNVNSVNNYTTYTLSNNKVRGAWARVLVNSSIPITITGVKLINLGSDFEINTDMYLNVMYDGINTLGYYTKVAGAMTPSYYINTNSTTIIFTNAPISNFCTTATSITIDGVSVSKTNFKEIYFSDEYSSTTSIGTHFLSSCYSLASIDLSSMTNVTSINGSFLQGSIVKTLKMGAIVPPSLLGALPGSLTSILVPSAAVNAYKSATYWSDKSSIISGY